MSEKLTDAELINRLARCPEPGSRWRHYKNGHVYEVITYAITEATQQPAVVYQRLGGRVPFCRPLAEWHEVVEHEGRRVERFREVVE